MTVGWKPFRSSASLTKARDELRKARDVNTSEALADLTQLSVTNRNVRRLLGRCHGAGQSNSHSDGCVE